MTILLAASALASGGLTGLLLKVAIACVIIFIALVCILIIYWLFEIFGSLI